MTPSAEEIADELQRLINDLEEDALGHAVGSGGLEAYYEIPEGDPDGIEYGLRFVVECNNALDWLAHLEGAQSRGD